jgi:hypothetical protein
VCVIDNRHCVKMAKLVVCYNYSAQYRQTIEDKSILGYSTV